MNWFQIPDADKVASQLQMLYEEVWRPDPDRVDKRVAWLRRQLWLAFFFPPAIPSASKRIRTRIYGGMQSLQDLGFLDSAAEKQRRALLSRIYTMLF